MYERNSPFCLAVSVVDLHTLVWNAKSLPGTIRSNLDPFSQHGDAELWNALHRSCLLDSNTTSKQSSSSNEVRSEQASTSRYDLDSTIESEGANLSVGERSLLSLARALVKDCKVVVLDEATLVMCSSFRRLILNLFRASVDLDTDSKIQHTIQTEFQDRTLLCIARAFCIFALGATL
jgi:ABC-type multidrug transport system fused ATPase/permease subunit